MNRLFFRLSKALKANYRGYFDRVRDIAKKSGRPAAIIFADTLYCAVRYGAGLSDYTDFHFYEMNARERTSYVTVSVNNKFVRTMNDPAYRHIFDSKSAFYTRFSDFLGREFIVLSQADEASFADFVRDKEYIFVKPDAMSSGIGVSRVRVADYDGPSALFAELLRRGCGVAEEAIVQHGAMASLNPSCVNTLRLITITVDGECELVGAVLKVGNGSDVDNMGAGGLCAPIDMASGVVSGSACVRKEQRHEVHPLTGVRFEGFEIPFFGEAKELVRRASAVVPQVRFVGWDVAITENGPVLVEGNYYPGNGLWQIPDGRGKMDIVKRYMKRVKGERA